MDTFLIMARALAKAASLDILRLDIQFNKIDEEFSALCVLGDTSNDYVEINYIISEDGTIRKREEGVCQHMKIS